MWANKVILYITIRQQRKAQQQTKQSTRWKKTTGTWFHWTTTSIWVIRYINTTQAKLAPCFLLVTCLAYSSTLKMKVGSMLLLNITEFVPGQMVLHSRRQYSSLRQLFTLQRKLLGLYSNCQERLIICISTYQNCKKFTKQFLKKDLTKSCPSVPGLDFKGKNIQWN
jgi:hypothetical protein